MPRAKEIQQTLEPPRPLRYFTLCASTMIDVFLLARERILHYDNDTAAIAAVHFCEANQEEFTAIKELVGVENAGFFGQLEELVLFEDDEPTIDYPTLDAIEAALEDEGLPENNRVRLQTKRTHLYLRASFPYDFINLDFCGYYYPDPPDVLKINRTVGHMLLWQRDAFQLAKASLGNQLTRKSFLLSVTCRYDAKISHDAIAHLVDLVRTNSDTDRRYKNYLEGQRGITNLDSWLSQDQYDFFLSSWPKDISKVAQQYGWSMDLSEYVHYERVSDEGHPYQIICLVARFVFVDSPDYLQASLHALDKARRRFIPEITRDSPEGQELLQNLRDIVALRNRQAERKGLPSLPEP